MDTFAQYMDRALYGPNGYYSSGAARSGKAGDYFTAPDVGKTFGLLLSEIFQSWKDKLRLESFVLAEAGAGEGRLAADILASRPFTYRTIEKSASRVEVLKKLSAVDVYTDIGSMPPMEGVLFGNELIDAFPVHRVRMKDGKLEEAYVGADLMPAPTIHWDCPSTPRLESYFDRLGIALPNDYETEVNLAMADWLREAGRALKKGLILFIDYGRPAHEYYAPERTMGTLRAFSKHRVSSNILDSGAVDLTADVDFTSLALDARGAGFVPLAFMEMGTFLTSAVSLAPTLSYRPLALRYLLHPDGLGAAFHVLILGKNIEPADWVFEHNRLRRLGLPI